MAQFAILNEEEMSQTYERAAAQVQVVAEDMANDPDMWQLFGPHDEGGEKQSVVIDFLTRVMSLGGIIGIKSACGLSLCESTWRNFRKGETDDSSGFDEDVS